MMALIKVGTACFNGLASVFRHFVGIEARITLCDQNVSRRVQHRVDGGLCSAFVAMARDQSTPFDALVLPGGHAKGMRPYLESAVLQGLVGRFFEPHRVSGSHRPVAAVCHGVLLAARSRHADTGRSMLWGRKTTALTWKLEKSAWDLTRWWARFWDPTYYRTYTEAAGEPAGYWGVEAEVKRALANDADFVDVPASAPHHWRKTSGLFRDRDDDTRAAWVVQDGPYLSARWPGDVHTLAHRFVDCLSQRQGSD